MQQRSANKEKNSNMWDISAAGHISSGQDSLSAAAREINEEVSASLNYNVDVKDFRYMFSYRKEEKVNEEYYDRQYFDFFILRKTDLKIEDIKMQESEVQAIKFLKISQIKKLLDNHEIIERRECYRELENYLFRM